MELTRRNLLGAGAAVGAGLLLPLNLKTAANAAVPVGVTPFTEQLPTLAELGVIDATGGGTATVRMVNATHRFHKAIANTPTFAYRSAGGAQDYLGPVIVAKKNVPFDLTVKNDLGAHPLASAIDYGIDGVQTTDATAPRAAVHLHGGNTDPASDGDPLDFFGHGASKTYHYGNTQEAAGLWYHDHALGITRLNVLAGLAGGYLVRDANDPGDGTLLPAPPYEVPLVVQDRMFNTDGTLAYPGNENEGTSRPWVPEFFGDVATVNGKAWPELAVARGKYRFRVYNGSQARFYNFRLMHGRSALGFFQIGTDGGLLDRPVRLNKLLLAPGERADLVVDFEHLSPGAKVIVTNDAPAPYPDGDLDLPQIMRFTVTGARGWTKVLTTATNLRSRTAPITRLAGRRVDCTRRVSLVEVHNEFDSPLMVLMNNRAFMDETGNMTVKSNSLEQWEFINTTVDAHPMHLHFAQFQVLNRQSFDADGYAIAAGYLEADGVTSTGPGAGIFPPPPVDKFLIRGSRQAPAANELGWKDTIVCPPGQVTRISVPFGPNAVPGKPMAIGAAHTGRYVSHCHILEHEENDMMMRYSIE
jgi:FtsP/CotA-like multicopper oxidase with cupredoxin domain